MIEHEKQECIPVGCVPPTAVAICWGGVCLPQCMLGYSPGAWDPQVSAWRPPPQVWAWTPPGQTPASAWVYTPPSQTPNLPSGCGLDISLARLPTSTPGCRPRHPSPPLPSPQARPLNLSLGMSLDSPLARPPTSP